MLNSSFQVKMPFALIFWILRRRRKGKGEKKKNKKVNEKADKLYKKKWKYFHRDKGK